VHGHMSKGEAEGPRGTARHLSHTYQMNLIGEGALVGLFGGAVVSLYRFSLSHAERLLRSLTSAAAGHPLLMALWFLALAAICLVVCRLMLWEPYTQGSGIPQVDAEVAGKIDMPWHRVLGAKFVEGTLCALGGLSLGREGPSVQLGGMAGKAVSKLLGRRRGEERLLVTCGAAAGMSAAFHAPLTGVLFAIEEIHKEFTAPLIISVMAASVVSDFLVSQVLGVKPVLTMSFLNDIPHHEYAFVLLMGLYCGVLGALHNKGMFLCQERLYGRIRRHLPYARLAVPFAVAGVVAFACPSLMCGGDAIIDLILAPGVLEPSLAALVALLVGKYLFTNVSFASGAPGGTLFPLVVMGALSGAVFSSVVGLFTGNATAYMNSFIVLGVAGLFSSVVRAPVTAVVLVFELTGSLDALLATSIVSIISYVTANMLKVDPFYEHLYANLVGTSEGAGDAGTAGAAAGEKELHSFVVGAGSQLEGRLVKDVSWPNDTLVVTVERGSQEILPRGDTRLQALDTLTVIMGTDVADDAIPRLRRLCRGSIDSDWTSQRD
jgi:H+/Cl- antiporter ClcA